MSAAFAKLSRRAKLIILVLSIFLLSLSVGMLFLGDAGVATDAISTDLLKHSKEQIYHLGP